MSRLVIIGDWHNDPLYESTITNFLRNNCLDTDTEIFSTLPRYDIIPVWLVVENIISALPAGSVIVLGIDSVSRRAGKYFLFQIDDKFFFSANTGLATLLGQINKSYFITQASTSFALKDVLLPEACNFIKKGKEISYPEDDSYKRLINILPVVKKDKIYGTIIYIDSYGNAITNITKELFYNAAQGRRYTIYVKSRMHAIYKVHSSYRNAPGEFIAIFNSYGFLEIAQVNGNISTLLQLNTKTEIIVDFS